MMDYSPILARASGSITAALHFHLPMSTPTYFIFARATLVDEEEGIRKLRVLMEKHERVVLLCAEKDEDKCHRSYIKKLIEGRGV